MASNYWGAQNRVPGSDGVHGTLYGSAGNNITVRGNEIPEGLMSQKPSRNMAESSIKVLRFYRKTCRMLPFILRIHNMNKIVTLFGAMRNVADLIRENNHYRDPTRVDGMVQIAYEFLLEAEQHHTQHSYIYQFLAPDWKPRGDRGYSYLEKAKYGKKSNFLLDFYKGNKPQAY